MGWEDRRPVLMSAFVYLFGDINCDTTLSLDKMPNWGQSIRVVAVTLAKKHALALEKPLESGEIPSGAAVCAGIIGFRASYTSRLDGHSQSGWNVANTSTLKVSRHRRWLETEEMRINMIS